MFNDQTVKKDRGKLQLSLVPMELIESVAVVRMYGNAKYPDGGAGNWTQVNPQRYVDAAFRHFVAYIREPYGLDEESNLPHLYHLACNIAFLLSLDITNGTIPEPQEALEKMHHPDAVQVKQGVQNPMDGCIYADDLAKASQGAEQPKHCDTCVHSHTFPWSFECNACVENGEIAYKRWEPKGEVMTWHHLNGKTKQTIL